MFEIAKKKDTNLYKDEYIGKMKSFDIYINYLISQSEFPCVDITTRKNARKYDNNQGSKRKS